MLFEMATGNLNFRIPPSENDDELDGLLSLLNSVAAEMHAAILSTGYVNPHFSYQNMIQTTFILNKDFIIKSFSADLPAVLGYASEKLFKMDFKELLAENSKALWEHIKTQAADNNFQDTRQLIFITAADKVIPSFCTISRLLYSNKIVISSVTTILQDAISDRTISQHITAPRPSDAAIIQNVYEYILNHLEEPLPTVKELSKMFGTNEFKLKDSFRHFFNTSIYQFYNDERLKRAHLLIQQTDLPIKAIALISGFNDYTNFYKAFKKRFGYTPSTLLRGSGDSQGT
jgi:AraC-like DNA-binding protein